MKFISKFLYHASAYTVIITMLFFAFAKISGLEETPSVTFGRYALIFAFGLVISASEYIFGVNSLPKAAKYVIHYLVLGVAFFFVFLSVRSSADAFVFKPATVFASLIIFTIVYFALLGLFLLFKSALAPSTAKSKKSKR